MIFVLSPFFTSGSTLRLGIKKRKGIFVWVRLQGVNIYQELKIKLDPIDPFVVCTTTLYGIWMVSVGLCVCELGGGGDKHLPPQHNKKGLCSFYIKIIDLCYIILDSIYQI